MNDKEFYKILNILEDRYGDISKFEFFENEIVFGYEKDGCEFEIRFDTEFKDINTACFRNDGVERSVYLDRNDLKTYLECLDVLGW